MNAIRNQSLPSYLYSYNAVTNQATLTYQRSSTRAHVQKRLVPDDIMLSARVMDFGDRTFQIIHCGEVYDMRLFAPNMPRAGIVFGHKTMPRLARTLRSKSALGFSLINTEHRWNSGGKLFCFNNGDNRSVQSHNLIDDTDTWIDIALWRLCKNSSFLPVQVTPEVLAFEL